MIATIKTKFGNASIDDYGYYRVHSNEKGNRGKRLHILIFEDFYKFKIPKGYLIHHKNGDKLNNCILNLQLLSKKEHSALHKPSEETKQKMSNAHQGVNNPMYGKHHTEESKMKISQAHKGENHHYYGKQLSQEHKQKLSKAKQGTTLEQEHKLNIAKSLSSTGIYRVTKEPQKKTKQGFTWKYRYEDENGKTKYLYSVDLAKLKKRVLDKGLEWIEFEE
jgi:hypothetical protein